MAATAGFLSYGPYIQEYALLAEYNLLRLHHIPGVYVLPSPASSLVWHGILFLRHGPYFGGAFRFKLIMSDEFPNDECPRVFLDIPVFHPLVDNQTGEVEIITNFPKWRKNVNHLWQILHYLRRIFVKVEAENAVNKIAGDLLSMDFDKYKDECQQFVTTSLKAIKEDPLYVQLFKEQEKLFSSDTATKNDQHTDNESYSDSHTTHSISKSGLVFSKLDDVTFDNVKGLILSDPDVSYFCHPSVGHGFSWINKETLQILSYENSSHEELDSGN